MRNNEDVKLRILWISDIHFRQNDVTKVPEKRYVEDTPGFSEYLSSFVEKCRELYDKEAFDYVLFSGDIAFSGLKEDYENFSTYILDPMMSFIGAHTKLLIIPGNHDVDRKNADSILQGFLDIRTSEKDIKTRNKEHKEFLEDNFETFCSIFSGFTTHFENNKLIPKAPSSLSKNKHLYGHVIDRQKKTIFVLLNTAWYSLGTRFLEDFLEKNVFSQTAFDGDNKKKIRKALEAIGDEYGNQITAIEIKQLVKEMEMLEEHLNKYPDYLVVTVLHHPINWLGWSERIRMDESDFHMLRSKTDLMLSGHEHVPVGHQPEFINNNTLLHLPSGCLISDKISDFDSTWFSTLDINVTKRNVRHSKFKYDKQNGWKEWNADAKAYKLVKKYKANLLPERRDEIKRLLNSGVKRRSFLETVYNVTLKGKGVYMDENGDMYVFVTNLKYYEENIESVRKKLLDRATVRPELTIQFVHLDLHYDRGSKYKSTQNRLMTLNEISERVDFGFDRFRTNIYSGLSKEQAKVLRGVRMVSTVYPYWVVESRIK